MVLGDIPVRHTFQRGLPRQTLRYPDLLVAFNIDPAEAIARRGYAIDDQGKPPDFVLEIASIHTALNDYTSKRVDYAAYGIPEYWRFDNTGGNYYPVALAGDRLVGREYQPIPIAGTEAGGYWGHSEALNLDLCWENGQLRWYDPVARRYLLTHDDALNELIAERDARITAEASVSLPKPSVSLLRPSATPSAKAEWPPRPECGSWKRSCAAFQNSASGSAVSCGVFIIVVTKSVKTSGERWR